MFSTSCGYVDTVLILSVISFYLQSFGGVFSMRWHIRRSWCLTTLMSRTSSSESVNLYFLTVLRSTMEKFGRFLHVIIKWSQRMSMDSISLVWRYFGHTKWLPAQFHTGRSCWCALGVSWGPSVCCSGYFHSLGIRFLIPGITNVDNVYFLMFCGCAIYRVRYLPHIVNGTRLVFSMCFKYHFCGSRYKLIISVI